MAEETEQPAKKSKKGLMIPAIVLALGLAGGGYFFMSGKKSAEAADPHAVTTTTEVKLGAIVRLSPITLNLSDGHVLKVGMALQMVEKPKDKELAAALAAGGEHGSSSSATDSPLGGLEAKALDQAINDLGNMTYTQLSSPGGRAAAKEDLTKKIEEIYEGDVVQVYFTDFVMS